MELQVTLTLSDRLFALLENKLPNLGRRIEKAVTKEIGAQTRRESSVAVAINATPAEAPAQAEAVENKAPAQQPEKALTEEDIRAAMHRTRQRFEGQDYKDNTDSEPYKKYHKQLTGMFKKIAAILGADKPSALPAEMRAQFIAECDALIIDETGAIAPPAHRFK